MMISRRIKLILGLLFCFSLSVIMFLLQDRTLCFDGAVVAKYDGHIEVVTTDIRRGLTGTLIGEFYRNFDCCFDGGEKIFIDAEDVPDRVYKNLRLGDEVRVYYLFDAIPNATGMFHLTNVFCVKEEPEKHRFPHHLRIENPSPYDRIYAERITMEDWLPYIYDYILRYRETDPYESGYIDVDSEADKTYYLLNRYETADGEKYIALVTETLHGDEINRTGEVYACAEISEVDGSEMIVLSDESGENQRDRKSVV